ncbi:uncharacterized protein C11orf24 homolog [Chaetodon auriga]|uniref:uncharacterized protein C11orf24 homolog n=1 Tax=Chaetodon auriga TaxID=39042 RepID=UPI0040329532
MSLYPLKLQLSPSVCLHLLCLLLLLTESSSTVPKKEPVTANPLTPLSTTQANCSTACDNDGVRENATDSSETQPQKNLNSLSVNHELNDTVASLIPPNQSTGGSNSSTASLSNQPASQDHPLPLPATETQHAANVTGLSAQAAHDGSITSTGNITSTTADPVGNVHATPVLVTSTTTTPPPSTTTTTMSPPSTTATTMSPTSNPTTTITTTSTTTTKTVPTSTAPTSAVPTSAAPTSAVPTSAAPTSAAPTSAAPTSTAAATTATTATTAAAAPPPPPTRPATTVKATVTTVAVTTTTGIKKSPPPSSAATPQPPVQTTPLPKGPVNSTITPASHDELVPSGTRGAVIEVAGAALTRQLVDTASLLAVLLFGLLFFLVTVAVFVTQAYESYRRKDYTQVDYLINGMYTDSGV